MHLLSTHMGPYFDHQSVYTIWWKVELRPACFQREFRLSDEVFMQYHRLQCVKCHHGHQDLMNCNLWLWVSELIDFHVPDDFMQIVLRHSVLRNTISRLIVASWGPQQFSYRGKNACKLWAKVAQQRKHGQFQLSMSLVSVLTSFVHVSV